MVAIINYSTNQRKATTMTLQFNGTKPRGSCHSTSNRTFTMTEEADICCYKANDIQVECLDDMAWLRHSSGEREEFSVQVFAVADNVYIAHQISSAQIYVTDSLIDSLDAAVEMIITA